jgi:hypothetical protein
LSAEQSWPLMTNALPKIASFIKTLQLPTVVEPQTNTIKSFKYKKEGSWCAGTITFHDGYIFGIEGNKVIRFGAPDAFFGSDVPVRVKDFFGKWKLTESEAVSIARAILKKFAVPARAFASEPSIERPYGGARKLVPRYNLRWSPDRAGIPFIQIEIDGESGAVKSMMIW